MNTDCPFCTLPTERIWFQDAAVLPFHDGYPVNPGHTLVIPRRHVQSAFDLASDELAHLWKRFVTFVNC